MSRPVATPVARAFFGSGYRKVPPNLAWQLQFTVSGALKPFFNGHLGSA
jgi:hypothetical protein